MSSSGPSEQYSRRGLLGRARLLEEHEGIVRSAAVAVSLLALTLIGGCGGGAPQRGDGEPTVATEAGHWTRIPRPGQRYKGLHETVLVVVGDRVALIAGADHDAEVVKGFMLDLDTRRWSRAAPSQLRWRFGFSAVAAGEKVIIWGGCCGAARRGSRAPGAIYDVTSDRWTPRRGPFGDRHHHTAVWTGKEMIVWGGVDPAERPDDHDQPHAHEVPQADGAAYDPRADRWRRIAPAPLSPRDSHVAVWTGKEMIVWGGWRTGRSMYTRLLYDGAAYDPKRDRWRKLAPTRFLSACVPAWKPEPCGSSPPIARLLLDPTERYLQAAWTGRAMVVWSSSPYVAAGALYEPDRDRWERIARPPHEILIAPAYGSAVWSGEELIVWGGARRSPESYSSVAEGAAYDPEAKRWAALPEAPISGRSGHNAIWTGEGMLIWGGGAENGAIYVPE